MKEAFVAMKFTRPPEQDPVYQRIRKPLREAGYVVTRADEIRTSGAVVDEVCTRLRESELVILDSTGDSHSVSYEIGYCHGIGRSADSTLLLKRAASDIPFNYRHFRHRTYASLPGLEKEIRTFLGLSSPIPGSALANTITFEVPPRATPSVGDIEACTIRAARDFRMSGRLEAHFSGGYLHVVQDGEVREAFFRRTPTQWMKLLVLHVAFQPSGGAPWEMRELEDFGATVARKIARNVFGTRGHANLSEFNMLKIVRINTEPALVCELRDGKVTRRLS